MHDTHMVTTRPWHLLLATAHTSHSPIAFTALHAWVPGAIAHIHTLPSLSSHVTLSQQLTLLWLCIRDQIDQCLKHRNAYETKDTQLIGTYSWRPAGCTPLGG